VSGDARRGLDAYRGKRDAARTPEPVPESDQAWHPRPEPGALSDPGAPSDPAAAAEPQAAGPVDHTGDDQAGRGDTFVIQEHHARALHWDFRLERDGVLVSWAVPKGLPVDRTANHLARQTEDHPLEYAEFAGEIPKGEYGGGTVTIWDRGGYELESWTTDKIKITLRGSRVQGRYVLFRAGAGRTTARQPTDHQTTDRQPTDRQTTDRQTTVRRAGARAYGPDDWMVRRLDPPDDPTREPMPTTLAPMRAVASRELPAGPDWAYEVKWDGMRVLAFVDGGRVRARSRTGRDVTAAFPELRGLGLALGSTQSVLDGEIVAFGPDGTPDFGRLAHRMHVADAAAARRLAGRIPVSYLVFDLLFLDGHPTTARSYDERRALLAALPGLTLSEALAGDGPEVLRASAAAGLEGVIAKRRSAAYLPGRRGSDWVKVKNTRTQSVVIGGWEPGAGKRADRVGSLLVGVAERPDPDKAPPGPPTFRYAGHVGTGFSDATLDLLGRLLAPLRRDEPPFVDVPDAHVRAAVWVRPELVAEVAYAHWTADNRLRHPSFKGLRDDLAPAETVLDGDTEPT
jgi:bifunctional non-homologous end joining protein LigD